MNLLIKEPTADFTRWFTLTPFAKVLKVAAVLALLGQAATVKGQEITDNFNTGSDVGWQHYTPTTSGGATPTFTFPTVGGGGDLGYELFGPAMNCEGLLQRGAAVRSEQYGELFYSVDLLNYAPTVGSDVLFGLRISGSLAPLSTAGYFNLYGVPAPRNRQALFANLAFTSEIITKFVDPFRGGSAALAALPPSRPLRFAVYGANDMFRSEIYDRTDLLEPLARINYQDYQHDSGQPVHNLGENSLGWLNAAGSFGLNATIDYTFDNYHATGSGGAKYVGFPGVAQVVNLKPAVQTIFYHPPGVGSNITFTATTFTTNQIATNTIRLFLNDVDVSSQLAFSLVQDTNILGMPVGTPNTNFTVLWNGTLSTNTVYHGQIRVLDTSGKGTTNNFYFDTFTFFNPTNPANPSKFILIEAEDFNYSTNGVGGQFQDYPLVSGTDDSTLSQQGLVQLPNDHHPKETLGPQVNGDGVGYYNGYDGTTDGGGLAARSDIVGMLDVDYHVNINNEYKNIGSSDVMIQAHQYRTADRVSTFQGTKGGGFDTPRSYRSNLVNNASGVSYVPDYIVGDMDPGDWLNYTRTFPNTNYQVYLRVSSQARQDVRLDEVTGDRTQINQTTVLRGQFLVPNTASWTRWRYVPLTDAAGTVQTLGLSGIRTLRLTANEVRRDHQLIDLGDLQLNWILLVPTNGAAASGPWIASARPSKDSANFDPAGTVQIVILNRGTAVVTGSIQLRFDGTNVTGSATITPTTSEGAGATVNYVPGLLLPNTTHNLSLVYGDGSTTQSNYWSFTVDNLPLITPAQALGGAPDFAFSIQVHKATNDVPQACTVTISDPNDPTTSATVEFNPFEYSSQRAERQLAGQMIDTDTMAPFANEAAGTDPGLTTNGIYAAAVINFEQCGGAGDVGTDQGFFTGDTNFPGILPAIYCNGTAGTTIPNHFALAASIKLLLSPGVYRMGVHCKEPERSTFKVTTGPVTGTELYLGSSEDLPGTSTDGQFEFTVQSYGLYKFRLLFGDDQKPDHIDSLEWYWVNRSNGVRTLIMPTPQLLSSPTVAGSYSVEPTAGIDPVAKTVTVAKSGSARFYKLSAGMALNITTITLSGGNVVLTYQ